MHITNEKVHGHESSDGEIIHSLIKEEIYASIGPERYSGLYTSAWFEVDAEKKKKEKNLWADIEPVQ